jgi:hypothetical protein
MSPAAYAMLMIPAKQQFNAALNAEDFEGIDAALATLKRLHRAYYGYDALSGDVSTTGDASSSHADRAVPRHRRELAFDR